MKRQIGILGTTARIIIGIWLAGSVVYGHVVRGPFRLLPWVIGLIIFPAYLSSGNTCALAAIPLGLRQTALSLPYSMS